MDRLNLHGAAPYKLMAELEKISQLERPPLETWNPPLSGDIDITITADGNWLHEGSPIVRPRLVRLFSTVLKREESGDFVLVTPVEKWRIRVEDAPFVAVLLDAEGEGEEQVVTLTTNVRDVVPIDRAHSLRVEVDEESGEPSPYVTVRDGLEAKLARSVYYQLIDLTCEREHDGSAWIGLWSCGEFFPLLANDDPT